MYYFGFDSEFKLETFGSRTHLQMTLVFVDMLLSLFTVQQIVNTFEDLLHLSKPKLVNKR
jgi:hypothetical protein